MLKRRKFLISGVIIFIAAGYLGYTGFTGAATYYYTVSEVMAQENTIYGENVRVNGQVAPGSIEQESAGSILRFTITDAETEENLPVVYHGVVPDAFKAGNEVVVEGHLNSDGIFQADTIVAKCPSKYVPK